MTLGLSVSPKELRVSFGQKLQLEVMCSDVHSREVPIPSSIVTGTTLD